MTFYEIEAFLEIVNTGSLTAAAKNLYTTQPAISKILDSMERELGVVLIQRNKGIKGNRLTEEGKRFLTTALHWQALMEETQSIVVNSSKKRLRISANESIYPSYLRNTIKRFLEEERDTAFSCFSYNTVSTYKKIERRSVDFGIVSNVLRRTGIIAQPIICDPYCLVISDTPSPLSKINLSQLRNLDPTKEVVFQWDDDFVLWHEQYLGSLNHSCALAQEMESFRCILNEKCWALVPEGAFSFMCEDLPHVSRVALSKDVGLEDRNIYLARRNDSPLSRESKRFFSIFREEAPQNRKSRINQSLLSEICDLDEE